MAERQKSTKKWRKTGKWGKILRKTGKEKCVGNFKMTFLSHGKPDNLKIFAKTESTFEKLRKAEKYPKDKEKWWKARKQEKKLQKARKTQFSAENRKRTPYNPPLLLPPLCLYWA